jgi:8-oxo-dGTP pyrophosphatase MutT (NUDIX family)
MRRLFDIDIKDYEAGYNVYRRPSARGIILQGDRIALVYSGREHYYKFPGGGIQGGEDKKAALVREVREETGLVVIPDSIREFGSVLRRQKSDKSAYTIFEQENFYYICDVEAANIGQELDEYEREAGFVLRVLPIDEAICANDEYHSDNYFDEIMIKRELRVLRMVKVQMKL